MSNHSHDLGVGFGANAGHCGLGSFGYGTGLCKDGCGRRVMLGGYSGFCAQCAPNHGIEPIKIGPEAATVPQSLEPKRPYSGGCC